MNWLFWALPVLAGMLMAVQGSINGQVSKVIGTVEGNFLMHCVGLAALFVLLFIARVGEGNFSKLGDLPWYGYLSGIINVVIIYGVMVSIPRLGAAGATTAIVTGQVLTAAAIDWLGLFGLDKTGFSFWQLLGVAVLGVGVRLLLVK